MAMAMILAWTGLAPGLVAAETPSVSDLAWLAGCWASVGGETGSGEQWTIPAGGTMLGTSRTVREGRTVAFEFLRIREREYGGIVYLASPSGGEATAFELVAVAEDHAVFENPDHDFPQRIVYDRQGDGMTARIETIESESSREFRFRRVDCDPEVGAGEGPATGS